MNTTDQEGLVFLALTEGEALVLSQILPEGSGRFGTIGLKVRHALDQLRQEAEAEVETGIHSGSVSQAALRIRRRGDEAEQVALDYDHPAEPRPDHPIWERTGHHSIRGGAKREDYPLSATCECQEPCYLASPDAAWTHRWAVVQDRMPGRA